MNQGTQLIQRGLPVGRHLPQVFADGGGFGLHGGFLFTWRARLGFFPSCSISEPALAILVDDIPAKEIILNQLMTPRLAALHSRVGFTLLELLLTIAIIGLLVSLLLPAVASAKSGAHRVTCMNNQKQLIVAMSMYATDNNDSAPHPNWDFNPAYAGWLCRPPFDKPATNIQTGLLWKYSPNAQVFMCPQDRTNTASFLARRQKYTSYIMNGAACFFETQAFPRTVKISGVRQDAIILWQADERNFRDFNDGASKPDEGVTRMHSDGSTVGVISGSVQHIKVREFNQEILKKPGRLWWNPKRKDGAG